MPTNTETSSKYGFRRPPAFFLLFLFSLLLSASCKNKKEKPSVPENLMKKVIVDMQMAESYSLGLGAETDSSGKVTRYNKNKDSLYVFYSAILNHYHLSFEAFNEAINWYKNHPEKMDSLLNHSIEELNREKARLGIATSSPERETNLEEPEAAPGFRKLEIDRRHSDSAGKLSAFHKQDTVVHRKDSVEKR